MAQAPADRQRGSSSRRRRGGCPAAPASGPYSAVVVGPHVGGAAAAPPGSPGAFRQRMWIWVLEESGPAGARTQISTHSMSTCGAHRSPFSLQGTNGTSRGPFSRVRDLQGQWQGNKPFRFRGDCGGAFIGLPPTPADAGGGGKHPPLAAGASAPPPPPPPPPTRFENGNDLFIDGKPGKWVLASYAYGDLARGKWTPLDMSAVQDAAGSGEWALQNERELPQWENVGNMGSTFSRVSGREEKRRHTSGRAGGVPPHSAMRCGRLRCSGCAASLLRAAPRPCAPLSLCYD